MEPIDHEPIPITQLPLFTYGESVTSIVELFPAVWNSTESLTSPDPITRQRGIDALLEIGAQKVSPLVAYMIATRLNDADIYIRRRVAYILADLIAPRVHGGQTPDDVRKVILSYLRGLRESAVYGLLEVSVLDQNADKPIYAIFNSSSYVGKYLGEILAQWKNPIAIQQKAIYFIGLLGYLDALPVLERLYNRLEARQTGQAVMDFAPPTIKSDDDLLPHLRIAINLLSAR
jgi:hypothetical protein